MPAMTHRGVMTTPLGPVFYDGQGPPTDNDMREVLAFQRFLRLGVGPDEGRDIRLKYPGWLAYCFGFGPPPPEGMDSVAFTAWTFPS